MTLEEEVREPWQMTMGMPAAMSTRAALIFVIMPPDPIMEPIASRLSAQLHDRQG